MAYNGYLIKVGGSSGTILPMKYIKIEGYDITPNQRMETEAKRAVTGLLHRNTVAHTASKIEFNTPHLTNAELSAMMNLFRSAWTSVSERKLNLEYYDMETDSYKTGTFYMPDIKYSINHIKGTGSSAVVIYNEMRVAFIEY